MNCIKKYRILAGLQQSELGKEMGLTQGAISHWELGARQPSISACRQILAIIRAHGVDCSLDDMFPAEEEIAA